MPFRLPWFWLYGAGVLVLRAELDVVVAVLAGQEPGQRLVDLDAVVDARLRGVVLLIVEVLEASVGSHFDRSRPLVLKQVFANVTFSRVHVSRSVLTLVFDSTELRLVGERLVDVRFLARRRRSRPGGGRR